MLQRKEGSGCLGAPAGLGQGLQLTEQVSPTRSLQSYVGQPGVQCKEAKSCL